ncbi:uncharacterized protein LOC131680659 [Topomyia yanbarensis]|uniref:uncharacterized protein LOC131680659 n=1 Tax=Topomyia yanbarensis TaxID=2498891 RepID=UPI00273AB2F9|nr:uncharacterized protein LOC131680659 [Topomyia yanbarensis]
MSKSKITVYFFTNGQPFKPPHKVVIDRRKLEENQVVERVHRLHYYNGYVVYTLFGQLLRSIQEIHDDSAFVAVPRDQCFQPGPYLKVFRQYINEKLPDQKDNKKSDKKKKATTKPLGTSFGCKAQTPRMAKEVRFCPGCRHVAVDTRCKDFGPQKGRGKKDTCACRNIDPHGECVPFPIQPKRKIKRKKSGGCSSCCKKKEPKREPMIRMRRRDMEQMEQAKARKERKTKKRRSSACCAKRPSKDEQYKKMRDKLIKERKKRLEKEEKNKIKEQQAIRNRIKSRRRRRKCVACCCPCFVKKPEPVWRQPTPHNCLEDLKKARDQAIRRRTALKLQEQSSWESINFPPKFRKKMGSTQTTKEDLKEARKASGGGWRCFGGGKKKKVETEEDLCS